MGCFNISGFYSHLPIKKGDRIGAIVCAQMESVKSGILINFASETGIFPIMAPVYGTYNEYGCIENIEDSYTVELFKKLTGHTVDEFITCNYRNGNVTINSKDNSNQYDNIPLYQSIIRYLVPSEDDADYVSAPPGMADPDSLKGFTEINEMFRKENDNARNSTFLVIYEHETVLEQLIKTGMKYISYVPDKSSISDAYDKIANILTKMNYSYNISVDNFLNTKHGLFIEIMNNVMRDHLDIKEDIDRLVTEDVIDQMHVLDRQLRDIKMLKMYMRLYKNAGWVDMDDAKNDVLDLMFMDKGLYWMHGAYNPCVYVGQDIDINDIKEMHDILGGIINEYKNN